MNETLQWILVGLIVAAAATCAIRRARKAANGHPDCGCGRGRNCRRRQGGGSGSDDPRPCGE